MADPLFNDVAALLHFDDADGSTTYADIIDGRSWSSVGNAETSNTEQEYGACSLHCPAVGDYVTHIATPDLDWTGDCTIEISIYIDAVSVPALAGVLHQGVYADDNDRFQIQVVGGGDDRISVACVDSGGTKLSISSANGTISAQTWHKICLEKDGLDVTLYVDGVSVATGTMSSEWAGSNNITRIGYARGGASDTSLQGYADEFRFTRGVRYGSGYTPAAAAFPDGFGPVISSQPQSVVLFEGLRANFEVGATGRGTLTYQWYQDGSPVGVDSPIYATAATVAGDDGDLVYVDVTDADGTLSSENATITLYDPPDYPGGYPCPSWDYNRSISATQRRTPFDSGWTRQRRQFNTYPETVDLSFVMGTEMFHIWYDWVVVNAYNWFNLPGDRFADTLTTEVARFISEIQYTYTAHDRVTATVRAEVRNA